ncbi:DUF881 domain-containing protein [Wenjunlia vitaminophila]
MSQHPPARSVRPRPPRPDASMSLLTNVMAHSLDAGYAEAASRRGELGTSHLPRSTRSWLGLAVGLVLAALVVTLGAAQAHEAAPTLAKEREELIERVDRASGEADTTQRQVEALRTKVEQERSSALRAGGEDERVSLMALLSGAEEVEGPGIKLVVDDAENARQGVGDGPRQDSSFSDSGRLRDRDLQRIVNGLWLSGAEAVAINGQRLTSLSAIRAAGEAILVDNKPLPPPYTVLAVGDGKRLRSAFQDSVDGMYLRELQENFDIRARITVEGEVRLPAAPGLAVRYAEPLPAAGPGDSGTTETKKGAS